MLVKCLFLMLLIFILLLITMQKNNLKFFLVLKMTDVTMLYLMVKELIMALKLYHYI